MLPHNRRENRNGSNAAMKNWIRQYPWLLYLKQSTVWVRLAAFLGVLAVIYLAYVSLGGGSHKLLSVDDHLKELYKLDRPKDHDYGVSETASRKIGLRRELPDTRPQHCPTYKIHLTVSVIIPAFNVPVSVLLRLVSTILQRTPPHILRDITIVDDNSDHDVIKSAAFSSAITALSPDKVMLLFNSKADRKRDGSVHAKMIGMTQARGDVFVFLDAMSEVNTGWVEPLVGHLQDNPSHIVEPAFDRISTDSLMYGVDDYGTAWKGGFFWDFSFAWIRRQVSADSADTFETPVLSGYAYAARKEFLTHLGGLNQGHAMFDGDHLSLSLHTWICQGKIVRVPCSRVGNTLIPAPISVGARWRFAKTWLPDSKYDLWASINSFGDLKPPTSEDVALVESFHRKMNEPPCKDFDTYISEVYPELLTPPAAARLYGAVYNTRSGACLTADTVEGKLFAPFMMRPCHALTEYRIQTQFATLPSGQLISVNSPSACLAPEDADGKGGQLVVVDCTTSPSLGAWKLDNRNSLFFLTVKTSKRLCLLGGDNVRDKGLAHMEPCATSPNLWKFQFVMNN